MERASSQREKGFGLDYLTEFQLASSSLMSGQSPMDQVFQTFSHHTPNSTSGQMAFQAPQTTYGHPAGQQYHVAPIFSLGVADRYPGMPYSQPYANEEYFALQCPPSSTHAQGQPYSGALPGSTPPMQSPQLSPMLRAHCQSPQHAPGTMMLHSKSATPTRAAPANSPQSSVFNAQLHGPQQHYTSTLGGPGYYTTSQCSQRNDPPVGNMHMTQILNSHTFNQNSQFSTHSQLPPSSQPSLRTLHNSGSTRLGKDSVSGAQLKNSQPSVSRPTGKESNLSTLQQSLTSNYLSSLAHTLQPRPSVAGASGTQGRFQPTMSMAPVRAHSASSASSTSNRKQNHSAGHPPAVSSSSKSSMPGNFEANFQRSAFSEMAPKVNREKQMAPSSGINSLQSNVYGRKKSANQAPRHPYNVYSIFSLNGQPARDGVRGKPEAAAPARPARPEDRSVTISKEMTPINWYKSPLMASSYSTDIEAMQADIIMESMIPVRALKQPLAKNSGPVQQPVQRPPRAHAQPPSTKPPNSDQLASNSGSIQQSTISQQPSSGQHSSISASKSAALAAIRIKQEQAESLGKNRSSKNGNVGSEPIAAPKAPERQSAVAVNSSNNSSMNIALMIATLPTQTHSSSSAKNKYIDNQKDCAIINSNAKPSSCILDPSFTSDIRDRNNPTISDLSNNVREKISSTAINGSSNNGENVLEHQKPAQPNFLHANNLNGMPLQLKIGHHAAVGSRQDKKQLSSMKKALNLWKAGQVVGRAPSKSKAKGISIPSSNMPDETPVVNSVSISKLSNVPLEKNAHLEGAKNNGSLNAHLVPDSAQSDTKAPQGVRTNETTLHFCYIILHGHKLVCLKSKNDASVLLCQFLSECFPDKGIGSVNNCIDRALRIKKRCVDHAKVESFLKKNGYSEEMAHTINLDDARRVYHYIYKVICNTSTCIVEVSHEKIDLDSLSMPARSLKYKEMANGIKMEANSIEDAGLRVVPQSQTMAKRKDSGAKSPMDFLGCLDSSADTDAHSIGSDHTEVYGKKQDNDDDLILVEAIDDPNIIMCTPDFPKAGGICNTIVGSVRYYWHNKENYLVVEDLCNIFSAPVFYQTVEKESIVLYTCSDEIADFLNTIKGTFPPLRSPLQSLIKEADVGALSIEDSITAGIQEEKSGAMKRPICKQEKLDEYESSSKKQKVDESIAVRECNNLPAANGMSEDDENYEHLEPARAILADNESESLQQSSETLSTAKPQTSDICESLHEKTSVPPSTTEVIFDQVALVVDAEPSIVVPANEQDSATDGNVHCIPETAQPRPEATPGAPVENEITGKCRPMNVSYSKSNNLRLRALKMRKMLLKATAMFTKDKKKQVTTEEKLKEIVIPCNSSDVIASSVDCSLPAPTTLQLETQLETNKESDRTVAGELNLESFSAPSDNTKEVLSSSSEPVPQCHKSQTETACDDVAAPCLVVQPETEDRADKVVEEASCEVDSGKAAQVSSSGERVVCQSEVVLRTCDSSANKSQSVSSTAALSSFSSSLSLKKSFDDLSIITSSSYDSLAARPSSQFGSNKSLCEGYDKLCFQNKSLLQFAHLLRKEMAANKEKAEKEIAANKEKAEKEIAANKEKAEKDIAANLDKAEKEIAANKEIAEREIAANKEKAEKEMIASKEKADREIARLQDMIKQITSGFKHCDEQAPILIDDDYCK